MRIFQPIISGSLSQSGSAVISGSLNVLSGITGSLQGTSSWAISSSRAILSTTAISSSVSDYIATQANETNSIFYPTFVSNYNTTADYQRLYTSTRITINPNDGAINASSFTGSLKGNVVGTSSWATQATTSSVINVVRNNTNANFYPIFVDSNNSPGTAENLYTESTITFNPNIGSLNVTSVTASLQGTASTASFVTSSNVYGPYGSNSILSASYAVTASYAMNSGGASPAGNQGNIQINSGSGQFYGDSGFSYLPSAERKIVHISNRDFDLNYYDQNANGAIQLNNVSSSIAPYNHTVNLVQKAKSIQPSTPTVVMGFDVQNSTTTHLKVTGFKCDYSIAYLESSPSVAISNTRTGTLLAAWAWDGTTTNITDNYVIADINGVLKDGIFTLSFNGTNIELRYDSGGNITESCIFTGLFTIFSNK